MTRTPLFQNMICFSPVFVPSLVPTTALKQLSQCVGRTAKFTGDYHLREQDKAKSTRNDCEMRKINCGDDVEAVGWDTCRFNSAKSTCQVNLFACPISAPFSRVTTQRHSPAHCSGWFT